MALPRCSHSFKLIKSDTTVVVWNCNICHNGPFTSIYDCEHCKLKTCQPFSTRLLHVKGPEFNLIERDEEDIPPYAILSHTREVDDKEYTFQDVIDGKGKDKPGYRKVRFCMDQAARDGLEYCWIDTCCIDRSNRAERQHATESMLRWYQNAAKCYVYLSDISRNPSDQDLGSAEFESVLGSCRWFSVAWNRSEVLTSASVEFFSREGVFLCNKFSIAHMLEDATVPATISVYEKIRPQSNTTQQKKQSKQYSTRRLSIPFLAGEERLNRTAQPNISNQEFSRYLTPLSSDRQKQAWMNSLYFSEMNVRQRNVNYVRPDSCQWLLYTHEYAKWLNATAEDESHWILRIVGGPGMGKSTLMRSALRNAQKYAKGVKTISFFFSRSRGSCLESSIHEAYRSLSFQLLEGDNALQEVFSYLNIPMPNGKQDSRWTIEALEMLIKLTVRKSGPILCFIDALDECPEDQARDMITLFHDIHATAKSKGTKFKVCFSSRSFPPMPVDQGVELVLNGQKGHAQAITDYTKNELRIGDGKIVDHMKEELQGMSSGVFLWVVLVVDFLNRDYHLHGITPLQQRLLEIPLTLDKLFRYLLSRSLNKDVQKFFFQLLLFARHPLSHKQLYSAIFQLKTTSLWNIENTVDVTERFVTEVSQGLTHVRNERFGDVQFIHESVREFVANDEFIEPGPKGDVHGQGHERLKQCCLKQICLDIFTALQIPKDQPEVLAHPAEDILTSVESAFPFLEYAVRNLLFHANAAQLGGVPQERFLETFPLPFWVQLHNLFEKSKVRRFPENIGLLYVLAAYNMPELIRAYPKPVSGLKIEDERYGCLVFAAMANGSKESVEAILRGNTDDYSVELNQSNIGRDFQFSKDRTILSYSAEFGFKGIVSVLLQDHAVDVNAADRLEQTAFMFAAREGHQSIVRMLLETGIVDINMADHLEQTAFMFAAREGHQSIVRMLLETGIVDVNAADHLEQTAFMFAAREGHESIVKMLLDTGRVNATSKNYNGDGPLTLAAWRGHRSVVQMLVDTYKFDAEVELLHISDTMSHQYETWMTQLFSERTAEIHWSHEETENDISVSDSNPCFEAPTYIHISQVADDILGIPFFERADISEVVRIYRVLPELLRTCTLEIGHVSDTQADRDVMAFVHGNRRSIAEHFLNAGYERRYPSQDGFEDTMPVQEKISRWNEEKHMSKDEQLKDASISDESFPKVQANYGKFQTTVEEPMASVYGKNPKVGGESNHMITIPSCSDFVTKAPSYELLLTRLRNELFVAPPELNHMATIRRRILGLLPVCNIIGKKRRAQPHTLRFSMFWDPIEFFKDQLYQEESHLVFEKVITLTGSAQDAQAHTCADYLSQTWPHTGKGMILFLKGVFGSGSQLRHECELVNGTRLTAWVEGSRFMVEASGTANSIAELGEQLAWLGAALRSSPFKSGVAYCRPRFRKNHDLSPNHGTTSRSITSYTIGYVIEEGLEQADDVNGQCWQRLFRNPVVVTGYPIPRRAQKNTGLEIPISLMVALCQARTVTIFDRKPFIKGFCTMLVPTKYEEHVVTWHVLANEDGSHISYADSRVQNTRGDESENIRIFDIERSRHIIGWCAYAKSYAGAAEADYDIGWSGLKIPYDGDSLLRKTIGNKRIASSESFLLGLKDIPVRNIGDQYIKRLQWIAGRFVVFFDVEDGRAWMFDGASSLLHLVRASLRFSELDDFSDQFSFRPHHIEEVPATKAGKAAAIWVLTRETNKRIKLYESTECLKDRVEDILHILEQIASHQDKAESNDAHLQQLEGFDFNAVAMVEERIKPRITELPPKGTGWVGFSKAVHAMNLFGSGFGELIRPMENKPMCSFWDRVPAGENHLTVCVSDIMRIQQREGSTRGGLLRLVDNIYWHKPDQIFETCLCVSENAQRHSDRIQILIPRGNLETNNMVVQNPGSLAPNGAVIFSYDSQNSEGFNDSGIGSNTDSLSATPANSQFEVDSDTSTMPNRKRSSSISVGVSDSMQKRGRVFDIIRSRSQGESSSAAGDTEKIRALAGADPRKRAKIGLPPRQQDQSTGTTTRSHQFTIGWISPLPLEKEAAILAMDEVYPQEEVQYDNAYYLGGRIGNHNVVVGAPKNMGLSSAAILAAKMSVGFPDIKYFLVVGIAGGVPQYGSAGAISEIVLGDVVVSYPRRKHGGVIQYDKGAWRDSGHLDFQGHINGVHRDLMAAINNFRAKSCFLNIPQVLQQMRLKLDERRKNKYDDPGPMYDNLYADTYEHQGTRSDDCKDCCDREHVISRSKRGISALRVPDSPFVHFGTIASSNQLQVSVTERKRLQQEHDVLCFEMEAAGVMEEYPCMVIRGICDYADSHKNKGWQNYAAATAAAYARGLLGEIPPICHTSSS